MAGQRFTPNPSAFAIAGTIVSAGGPAATISGTIIRLLPSGTLLLGTSTILLLPSPHPSDITIDGFDINAQSSFVVLDGITLSPGAAGVTISGTRFSLEAGGATLDIGTGRFALPTPTTGPVGGEGGVQAFLGGQGQGMEVEVWLLLVCGVCGTVLLSI